MKVLTQIKSRQDFRTWLTKNHATSKECWIYVKRAKPTDPNTFYYLDAVEEALCFGWIDSVHKKYKNKLVSRFSPRRKNSYWTELNKARVKRLEKLGLMTDAGRKVLPKQKPYQIDKDVMNALKQAKVWTQFKKFPLLYQRIRSYNVAFYKDKNLDTYHKALKHLITETKKSKMYGEWNDYGRLLDY